MNPMVLNLRYNCFGRVLRDLSVFHPSNQDQLEQEMDDHQKRLESFQLNPLHIIRQEKSLLHVISGVEVGM